ncbi:MAG: CvpA family protein [Muribaculaceae bacterium]|nr:CvpA family protein [Muribaculaceae bacterium]
MTAIDLILLFITVVALFTGAMKGFVHQLGTIAGVVLGILACRIFGDDVAAWFIGRGSEHADALRVLAYICLFVVVFLSATLLGRLLGAILSAVKLRFIDRIGGALFRAALWLLVTSMLINVYLCIIPEDASRFNVPSKPWRGWVADFAPKVLGYFTN